MAEVILFHHVLGLTPGVRSFADQLRASGHQVTAPDLFDGATFDTIDEGIAHLESVGFQEMIAIGVAAAEAVPQRVVYAGFSLGALITHKLAQTRAGALGALLYHHGDVEIETFGETWPSGVDLEIHINGGDEFYYPEIVQDFIEKAGATSRAELFVYEGSAHLFADPSLPDYEPQSAAHLLERSLAFLDRVG